MTEAEPDALPNAPPPQRDEKGHLLPGHTISVKHALFSERDLANLKAEIALFLEQSIADDGGESEVAVRRRSLLEYRARLHRRITQLDAALEARGLFDPKGKLRVAWISKLESLIGSARGIDNLLGLDRRARQVTTLAEVMLNGR